MGVTNYLLTGMILQVPFQHSTSNQTQSPPKGIPNLGISPPMDPYMM